MSKRQHIDDLLTQWPYKPGQVSVRTIKGKDGRELLQMRVEMGLLQMETTGRPDGAMPKGAESYYDYLLGLALHSGDDFDMDEDQCAEVDREFVQYYHRRICWLALHEYRSAVRDADHTLDLMDFCRAHAPEQDWSLSHEQYRPFVVFHRTQAAALAELEDNGPEAAINEINQGLNRLKELFSQYDAEEHFDEDELVVRLVELRESLREQHEVGRTLHERLADAVAAEHYELAAELRDELSRRGPRPH